MLLPKEKLEELAVLNPEIAEFVASQPPRPPPSLDHLKMREMMEQMDAKSNEWTGPPFTGSETYHDVEMRDGFKSPLKIQRPADGEPGPLIVLAFGGGFVGGDNGQFTKLGRVLVNVYGATVVSLSYRVGPEHKFPASQLDSLDSMKWIAANATSSILASDPKKGFIMGGVSAGGSITGALSRLFQKEPLEHPLSGQWLCIPSLIDPTNPPDEFKEYYLSNSQQANNPFFSSATRKWLEGLVEWDASSPLRNAIHATTPMKDQPKTYFQIDGADPLRDDGYQTLG